MDAKALIPRLAGPGPAAMPLSTGQRRAVEAFRVKLARGEYPQTPHPCLCGVRDDERVAGRDRYGLPLETVLCRRCGRMRSDPYFSEDALAAFYRDDYRAIYSSALEPAVLFDDELRAGEKLARALAAQPGVDASTVFEIGCGAGGVLEAFRARGARVAGCDFDERHLAFGRARGLALENGDLDALRPHGTASLVLLRHVLEHLRDPVVELRRVAAMLAPGGRLCVELPGIFSIGRDYGDLALFLQNAHAWHFGLGTLDSTLALAGWERTSGDESIRAVYGFAPAALPPELLAADPLQYARVRDELVRLERARYLKTWVALRQAATRTARRVLGDGFVDRLRGRATPVR